MNINPEIIDLAVKVIFGLLGLGAMWCLHYAKNALKARTESDEASQLDVLIYDLVAAAEQLLKKDDPDGSKRNQYVKDNLKELGIVITEEINARIEAAVFGINRLEKN